VADTNRDTIETEEKAITEGKTLVTLWLDKIKRARDDEDGWRKDGYDALHIYEADDEQDIAFNILHSNVETLLPAVYNSTPIPDVRRRFSDPDPIAKHVVDLTERGISFSVDQYDYDSEMIAVIRDALVPGRGVPRIRYIPTMKGEEVTLQEVKFERWPWDKFVRGPARSWDRVPWIAFEHDLTRDELVKLNPEIGGKVELKGGGGDQEDGSKKEADALAKGLMQTAKVWEIWDKKRKQVLFVAECYPEKPIRMEPDPLGLPDFFPAMRPVQVMRRASSLTPVCPYKVYKPLIDELDLITKRISKLVRILKVRGIYDSELDVDFQLLKDADDGMFMSAQNATKFAASGRGLDGSVWAWPMDATIAALQQLYVQRDQIKATIYEVTGISDIVRGASNANETATAQNIKSQWGSLRIQQLQQEVARVSRDIFRAKVAIMAGKFQDQQLQLMTSLPQTPEQQQVWPQVLQLFRSDMRSFRIDIETDSTVRGDMTRNQEQMNQFLAGTGQFAQAMAGAAQQFGPQVLPVMAEVYTAFARKFKLGKQAEDALDQLSTMAQQASQNPQEEAPDPAIEKAKMEMEAMQAEAQIKGQERQAQMQADQQKTALDMQTQAQKAQMELQSKQADIQIMQEKAQIELAIKREELAIKREELALKRESMQLDKQSRMMEHDMKIKSAAIDLDHKRQGAVLDFETKKAKGSKDKETPAKQGSKRVMRVLRDNDNRIAGVEEL
jgi:hypothetical protein